MEKEGLLKVNYLLFLITDHVSVHAILTEMATLICLLVPDLSRVLMDYRLNSFFWKTTDMAILKLLQMTE